jgi:hypothetical protein
VKDTDRAVRLAAIRERWKYASGYADLRPGTPVADLTWLLGEVARLEQDRDEWQAATARAARVKAEAALAEARRVLKLVDEQSRRECPVCFSPSWTHGHDCALAAALAQGETR